MTECERIIKEGILPESFFKPETICDFYVDEKRKKLWAILLDLMLEFDRVCKKNNIKYFLFGGTLLGAVRHGGFIPWDDDADVIMLREDYEKLLKLSSEFKSPYFFQTAETDPGFYYSCARVRNSNTTAMNEVFKYQGYNNGVWLDIFPLDNWEDEGGIGLAEKIKYLSIENSTYMRMSNPCLSEKDKIRVQNHSGRDPLITYREIHALAQTHCNKITEKLAHLTMQITPLPTLIYEAVDFSTVKYAIFEGYRFPIPGGYKRQLQYQYGDYMQLPPIEHRGTKHSEFLFDPDTPYIEYLRGL